ncbi:MAG TPA: rhodanese-like domain-containing protein [Edaphocola sp.]|nr:rhodanese-like domain-containing protein [Edaphocola sp.]
MKHTNPLEVKSRLDSGATLNIVDVREANEFEEDNIGALLLPLSEIKNFETEAIDDLKDQEIILHCRGGQRSMQAAQLLEAAGFTNVINLDGGIMEWRKELGNFNLK